MALLSSITTNDVILQSAVKTQHYSTAPPVVKLTETLLTFPCLPLHEHKDQLLEQTILLLL